MNSPAGGLWGLRQMARQDAKKDAKTRPVTESCDLCAEPLGEPHAHMLDPEKRTVMCACAACALLLGSSSSRFRHIPPEVKLLPDCRISDMQWLALGIPINLAFIVRQSATGQIVGLYPSFAGITESSVPTDVWSEIVQEEPRLAAIQDDVQALLVNRVQPTAEYYIAPLDQCYRLAGLIRVHWKGLSGGTEVWKHITGFFEELGKVSIPNEGGRRA